MKALSAKCLEEIVLTRQHIHQYPELSHHERNTSELVLKLLKTYGYDNAARIAETGVVATLDTGLPGKTLALRADIDALPIQELTQVAFKSKNEGLMHACGHDGHTATLLAVAKLLFENKSLLKGKVKLIFQPAEEKGTGALALINAGVLKDPEVDVIFGYHNTPRAQLGQLVVKSDCLMASQDSFTIKIEGKGGHAVHLDTIIDPIYIGCLIVQALQAIVSRSTSPLETLVISVTQFHGGSHFNVTPDFVTLNGTIRSISKTLQDQAKDKIKKITQHIAAAYHANAMIEFSDHFPPTINPLRETQLVISLAEKLLGKDKVTITPIPSMACEDFSYYLEKIPGCYFFMGNGTKSTVHSGHYEFNDELIPIAANFMAELTIHYLNNF